MAFCPNCGAQAGAGRFCGSCGAALTGASQPGASAPTAQPGGPAYTAVPPAPIAGAGEMAENLASALCYALWFITGVLFLVLEPYNRNKTIRFHAFQSIFTFVALVVIWTAFGIVFGIVGAALAAVSDWAAWAFVGLMWKLLSLAAFLLWLFLMWKAYNREKFLLPVVGPLAEKQA